MAQQRYSDEEAEQILRLAARSESDGFTRDRLVAMAGEIGMSAEQVARAEHEFFGKREAESRRRESRRVLWSHVAAYLAVNAGLFAIDRTTPGLPDWAFWPLLFWSTMVASHFANVFWPDLNNGARMKAWAALNEGQRQIVGEIVRANPQQKLLAISEVRKQLGLGLREAKDAVDQYELMRSRR